MTEFFRRMAHVVADATGSAWAFLAAAGIVVIWAAVGPLFGFSDTWMLWINTLTTIVTFLMVFLIQNSQDRDTKAMQLKLDELIRATESARDEFTGAERKTAAEIKGLREESESASDGQG